MGINHIVNTCSHLQNASKARLGLTSIPNLKYNLRLALALHRAGFISSVTRAGPVPPPVDQLLTYEEEPVTTANVATRRLWLGLKYWNNEPVMRRLDPISKPSRLITMQVPALERISRGRDAESIKGLELGECLFLTTDVGVLEVREALARKRGGTLLCRVK